MKNVRFLSMLLVLFTLAACSDDDPKNLAESAVGNYSGYTVASCAYFSDMAADKQNVTITTSEVNKINISYQSPTWGTVTIEGADLNGTEDNLRFIGSGTSLMSHAGNEAKEYACSAEGSLNDKKLELTFSCPAVMGGLKIVFRQGEIPADIVVPGTYKGYTEAKSTYFSGMMAGNQTIEITKNNDDTYKIAYISDTWGEFTIASATASRTDGEFSLTGDGITKMGMNGNVKEYNCTVKGTIDTEKENPSFTFTVPSVMGGLEIVFHTGDMPEAE